jgi:predicted signal transduction protein with EAL and GGDEF domain
MLAQIGCDQAQGYLLARPMPAEQFASWFAGYLPSQGPGSYDVTMNVRQLLPGPR